MPTLEEILAKRRKEQEESELKDERFFSTTSEVVQVGSTPDDEGTESQAASNIRSEISLADALPPPIPPRQPRRKSITLGAKAIAALEPVGEEDEEEADPERDTSSSDRPTGVTLGDTTDNRPQVPTAQSPAAPPSRQPSSAPGTPAPLGKAALPLLRKAAAASVPVPPDSNKVQLPLSGPPDSSSSGPVAPPPTTAARPNTDDNIVRNGPRAPAAALPEPESGPGPAERSVARSRRCPRGNPVPRSSTA